MRWLGFAFGLAAYLAAVRALVYLIPFLGDFWVAKTIDRGAAQATAAEAVAVELALLLLFALHHSVLARPAVRAAVARLLPAELERSTYSAASALLLLLLYWQWRPLREPAWEIEHPLAAGLLWALFAGGWLLAAAAIWTLGNTRLFGLRQAWAYARRRPAPEEPWVRHGVFARLRQPLFLGFLVAVWATPRMSAGHLLFALFMTGYLLAGMRLAERDLARRYGAEYERYRRSVSAFLPFGCRRPEPSGPARPSGSARR